MVVVRFVRVPANGMRDLFHTQLNGISNVEKCKNAQQFRIILLCNFYVNAGTRAWLSHCELVIAAKNLISSARMPNFAAIYLARSLSFSSTSSAFSVRLPVQFAHSSNFNLFRIHVAVCFFPIIFYIESVSFALITVLIKFTCEQQPCTDTASHRVSGRASTERM